jgi:hypothetical protein
MCRENGSKITIRLPAGQSKISAKHLADVHSKIKLAIKCRVISSSFLLLHNARWYNDFRKKDISNRWCLNLSLPRCVNVTIVQLAISRDQWASLHQRII